MKLVSQLALATAATLLATASYAADEATAEKKASKKDKVDFDISGVFIEDGHWFDDIYAWTLPEDHGWLRRRATLEATLSWDKVELVAEGGYNNSTSFEWRDAYAQFNLPGPYSLRAGLMKPDFGVMWSTSLKNLLTLERSIALDVLDLHRSPGIVLEATPGNHRAELGWYEYEDDNGETIATALGRYVYAHKGEKAFWQAGLSLAHEDYDGAVYRARTRAETTAMDNFLRTERITAEHADYSGVDFLYQRGRFTLLSEAVFTKVRSPKEEDRHYDSRYVQASWFLTPDDHGVSGGTLQRVNPAGWGAAELVAGIGVSDTFSENDGFTADTRTVGVNFYYGDHLKLMTQVDWLDIDEGRYAGLTGTAATARLQYRF